MIQITKAGAAARLAITSGLAYLAMSTTLLPHGFTLHEFLAPSVVTPSIAAAASAAFLFINTAWAQAHNQPAPAGPTVEQTDAEHLAKIKEAAEAEVTLRMQSNHLMAGIAAKADAAPVASTAPGSTVDGGGFDTAPSPQAAAPGAGGTEGD